MSISGLLSIYLSTGYFTVHKGLDTVISTYVTHVYFTIYRHILAILHFNEHLKHEKCKAKDGTSYVIVVYPKYNFGEEIVREIAVPATYGNYLYTVTP